MPDDNSPILLFGANVPGSLVWLALGYAGLGTLITHLLGRRLIVLNFQKQRYEANFRYAMARIREHAESVAFLAGERNEQQYLTKLFDVIKVNWLGIMSVTKRMTFFASAFSQAALVFPLAVVAPAFFADRIPLGGIFQTANAFVKVQEALSWIVLNYERITEWSATVRRLHGFVNTAGTAAAIEPSLVDDKGRLELCALTIMTWDGETLIENANLTIPSGTRMLLTGPSGSGKSTLLRVIAGLHAPTQGQVILPRGRLMFLPQKPYIPTGTLRRILSYPEEPSYHATMNLEATLRAIGLERLVPELDHETVWSMRLSGGEAQRLAIARLLLTRPDWVFLDEATSNLDEESEGRLYRLLLEQLPNAAIVSIGHRSSLNNFHNHFICLNDRALHQNAQ